jgi:hypothetical protein
VKPSSKGKGDAADKADASTKKPKVAAVGPDGVPVEKKPRVAKKKPVAEPAAVAGETDKE